MSEIETKHLGVQVSTICIFLPIREDGPIFKVKCQGHNEENNGQITVNM